VAARGCAFGDFDNDGDVDVVVNTVNDFLIVAVRFTHRKQLDQNQNHRHEIESQRHRRAHQVRHASAGETNLHPQIDEVRSGGGYFSQNDLRVHFGIGKAKRLNC